MKVKFKIICLLLLTFTVKGYGQQKFDNVFYSQRVIRDDKMFVEPFSVKRGYLMLTNDSLVVVMQKAKKARFNFSVSYSVIKSIRPFYGFVFPNRIKIKTHTGESYRLFTYRKRSIIKLTRAKMILANPL